MSHLTLVSNLTVAVGARPHFERQSFSVPPAYHPADVRLESDGVFDGDVHW